MISTQTLTGRPAKSPPKNVKKAFSAGSPVTCSPSLSACARPRYIDSVASVATIAGMATNCTRIALNSPIAQPSRIPSSAASHGFIPCCMNSAEVTSDRPNIDPTDRSISRIEIRNAMPAAMIPTYAAFWTTSLSWPHSRKSGWTIPMKTTSATVATRTLFDSTSSTRRPTSRSDVRGSVSRGFPAASLTKLFPSPPRSVGLDGNGGSQEVSNV
jgi:hypothetical protein